MKQRILILLLVVVNTACGVRGEPSRRQDELFIRKSQVVKSIEEQSLNTENEQLKEEKIIKKKEKR